MAVAFLVLSTDLDLFLNAIPLTRCIPHNIIQVENADIIFFTLDRRYPPGIRRPVVWPENGGPICRVANEDGPSMKLMSGLPLLVTLARRLQLLLSAHPRRLVRQWIYTLVLTGCLEPLALFIGLWWPNSRGTISPALLPRVARLTVELIPSSATSGGLVEVMNQSTSPESSAMRLL